MSFPSHQQPGSSTPSSVQWGATPSLLPASIQWGSNTSFGGSTYASTSAQALQDPFMAGTSYTTPPPSVPDRNRKSEVKRKRFDEEDEDEEMGGVATRSSPSREREADVRILAGRSLVPKRLRAGLGLVTGGGTSEGDAGSPRQSSTPWRSSEASNLRSESRSGPNDVKADDPSGNNVDLGKLLASLDKPHLLSLLSSLLSLQPQLASTIHSLIPTPTLESVNMSLDAYEASIKQALPFGHGAIRPEYAWNRLKIPVADMVSDIQGWMEFFRAKQEETSTQNQGVHPNTMFALLHSITAKTIRIQREYLPPVPTMSNGLSSGTGKTLPSSWSSTAATSLLASLPSGLVSPHSPNVLINTLLPLLLGAWDALLARISHDVNGLGKMFGREVVVSWLRGLEQLLRNCDSTVDRSSTATTTSSVTDDGRQDSGRISSQLNSDERETAETLQAVHASIRSIGEGFKREIGWVVGVF